MMPKHLNIFCISEKLLYMSVHVKTVDKNIFSVVIFSWWWQIFTFRWIASNHYKFFNTEHIFLSVCKALFSLFNILLVTTKSALICFNHFKLNRISSTRSKFLSTHYPFKILKRSTVFHILVSSLIYICMISNFLIILQPKPTPFPIFLLFFPLHLLFCPPSSLFPLSFRALFRAHQNNQKEIIKP